MKRHPRLTKIAGWRNKATEEELKWLDFAWGWFQYNVNTELFIIDALKQWFREGAESGEMFSNAALVILDTSVETKELRKRFGSTRSEHQDEDNSGTCFTFSVSAPSLSEESRSKLSDVLDIIFEMWQEGVLDKDLNHPRLKQCTVCNEWFAACTPDQKYCTSDRYPPCHEVASRGKARENSPQRLQYRKDQRIKMADRRKKQKENKECEVKVRDEEKLRDLRRRPTLPTGTS